MADKVVEMDILDDVTINSGADLNTITNDVGVVDPSVRQLNDNSSIDKMTNGNILKSANFVTGSIGWQIDGAGNAEFNNVTVRGTIIATTGAIGGFNIGSDYLRDVANSFGLSSTVTAGNDVRIWAGDTFANRATAPFRVYEDGSVVSTGLAVSKLDIPDTTTANSFHVDTAGNAWWGSNTASSYTTAPASVLNTGLATFNNVYVRGEIKSQVLSYGSVQVTAGSTVLALSGGTLKNDVTTVTSPTTFNVDITDPPSGHVQVFAVSDILRIKDGSGNDNWMTISSVSDQTTFFRYVSVKNSGTNATFFAGAAVSDYGQSGQGLIFSTVDSVNAPYISVQTHSGTPWISTTEQVRMGNLNGNMDYVTNIYGFTVGQSTGMLPNITIDPTNGLRIRAGTVNKLLIDPSGNTYFAGNFVAPFTAGQDITLGDSIMIADGTYTTTGTMTGSGSLSGSFLLLNPTTDWVGNKFTTPSVSSSLNSVTVHVGSNNGSSMTFTASIRATSGGLPTGSDLANSTTTWVTTTIATHTFTFSGPVLVTPNTLYALVIRSSSAQGGYQNNNGGSPAGRFTSSNSGSSWSTLTGYMDNGGGIPPTYNYSPTIAGLIYKTSAALNNEFANNFVGFAMENITKDNSGKISVSGVVNNLSGLSIGKTYFLSDTIGLIATSAGSQSRKIGLSISATSLLIKYDNF